jgi:hypothetical protein
VARSSVEAIVLSASARGAGHLVPGAGMSAYLVTNRLLVDDVDASRSL